MTKKKFYEIQRLMWQKWEIFSRNDKTDATFCNCYIADVCLYWKYYATNRNRKEMGVPVHWPLKANAMHKLFKKDKKNWRKVDTAEAIEKAGKLNLVIAAQTKVGHGHVCVLMPGQAKSGKWKKPVPLSSNIEGKNMWNMAVSFFFREEPEYFVRINYEC